MYTIFRVLNSTKLYSCVKYFVYIFLMWYIFTFEVFILFFIPFQLLDEGVLDQQDEDPGEPDEIIEEEVNIYLYI